MRKSRLGLTGIIIGGLAVLASLVHFWAGPFSPPPTLESIISEQAAAIRQATIDVLEGRSTEQPVATSRYSMDRMIQIGVAILGGLALILAALSFSTHESNRAAVSAALLGVGAIAFQFFAWSS